MLTSTIQAPTRPAYRPFGVRVARLENLTPHFIRVTLSGDDLDEFGTEGLDQRVKIVLPLPRIGTSVFQEAVGDPADAADWYAAWRGLPEAARNPLRTYTVRAVRPGAAEVDVDFVAHGDEGPASAWLTTAKPGDELMIVGPDALAAPCASGIAWQPGNARTVLLAGDETAAPAICSILEALEPHVCGAAFIEVPDAADELPVAAPAGVTVTWLPRGSAAPGSLLDGVVREWLPRQGARAMGIRNRARKIHAHGPDASAADRPLNDTDPGAELLWEVPAERANGRLYAWIAGEAGAVKDLRRYLVAETGMDRRQVAFMGYWRRGTAEAD